MMIQTAARRQSLQGGGAVLRQRCLASLTVTSEVESAANKPISTTTNLKSPVIGLPEPWMKNLTGTDDHRLIGKRDPKWWFTGTLPQNTPGFDGKYLRSLAQPRLDGVTKHAALAYFQNGWTLYENLFASLQGEEAFYRPPQHGLRHPMQFYYGHTAVFYINKSIVAGLLDKPIEPKFESQFEVGVDEMRWDDMTLGDKSWPRVSEVRDYRQEVYRTMIDLIERNFDSSPKSVGWDDPLWSFFMTCEHDRIHVETSSVLIRELPLNLVRKPEFWPDVFPIEKGKENLFPRNELVSVKGDTVAMGKAKSYPSHGWDNEYGRLEVQVSDFQASKDLVTNGEFLEFVKQGGYRERKYWSEDGWGWRRFRNAQHPFFWVRNGPQGSHKYLLRHTFEMGPFALGLPVVVNHHESKAFCNWKAEKEGLTGLRLPTEAEHQLMLNEEQRMSKVTVDTDPAMLVGGDLLDSKYNTNSALAYGSERPVDHRKPNKQGLRDTMGNLWHWCEDHMAPFPGFATHPYYGDFTEPCFDGKHNIIKGGSFASTGDNGCNAHCRYHFRPHFLQHSGIRYVLPSKVPETHAGASGGVVLLTNKQAAAEAAAAALASNPTKQQTQADYETERMVSQYLALHFGKDSMMLPHPNSPAEHAGDFPRRCAKFVVEAMNGNVNGKRALDLGCAVGGSTFHLASLGFKDVVGIDFSKAFVDAADRVREHGKIDFVLDDKPRNVELSPSETVSRMRASFQEGDACALKISALGGKFDAVLGANLLCRLPSPHDCLKQMPDLVNKNGLVVFISPFSWLTSFTPKDRWLGSVGHSEKELIAEMRSLGFSLVKEDELPLIIRDHPRKYQYIISHAAAFRNDN